MFKMSQFLHLRVLSPITDTTKSDRIGGVKHSPCINH